MMQNGLRTSGIDVRSGQLCFWCMSLIFLEFVNEDDVFGKIHLPAKVFWTANDFAMVFAC